MKTQRSIYESYFFYSRLKIWGFIKPNKKMFFDNPNFKLNYPLYQFLNFGYCQSKANDDQSGNLEQRYFCDTIP